MGVEAWPFLVSRNKKFGYRTVVAPQFLYDQKASNLLAETAGGDLTDQGCALYRKIYGSKAGDLTLVFRVVRAENSHIGFESSEVLTDQFGRPIDLVEGIVLKGIVSDILLTDSDLQFAHKEVVKAYQEFWNDIENIPTIKPSTSFHLQTNSYTDVQAILKLKEEAPFSIKPTTKTKEEWLDEGDIHYKTERYEEALAAYEQAIRLDSNFALAYVKKSKAFNSLERYKEALTACEQAVRLDPDQASAHLQKGNALYYLERHKDALAAYERAIHLDSAYVFAYFNQGNVFYVLKRYKDALIAYEQAIHLDPSFVRTYIKKGDTLYNLKRYEEALVTYEQAIHLDPSNVYAHNNKGLVLYGLERYKEALTAYEQAIQLDPKFADAYIKKGRVLYEIGSYQEALTAYEQAIQLEPKKAILYHYKGDVLFKLDRLEEAKKADEKARQLGYG